MGSTLLMFVLASLLAALVIAGAGVPMEALSNPEAAAEAGGNTRMVILMAQALSSVFIFGVSSWITLHWGMMADIPHLNAQQHFRPMNMVWVFLVVMVAMPFIGFVSYWNQQLSLDFLGTELAAMMVNKEQELKALTEYLVNVQSSLELVALLMVVSVFAGVFEELFFRGMLQNVVHRLTGNMHFAIWAVALLFGAIHFQFLTMFPRVILGALFGYIYVWSGNLYLAMAGHFINNFVTAVGMITILKLGMEPDAMDQVPWSAAIFSAVAAVAGLLLFRKRLTDNHVVTG